MAMETVERPVGNPAAAQGAPLVDEVYGEAVVVTEGDLEENIMSGPGVDVEEGTTSGRGCGRN